MRKWRDRWVEYMGIEVDHEGFVVEFEKLQSKERPFK